MTCPKSGNSTHCQVNGTKVGKRKKEIRRKICMCIILVMAVQVIVIGGFKLENIGSYMGYTVLSYAVLKPV